MTTAIYPSATIHSPTTATRSATASGAIDLVDPAEACRLLDIEPATLIALANQGLVAAFDLGGSIRFRRRDLQVVPKVTCTG